MAVFILELPPTPHARRAGTSAPGPRNPHLTRICGVRDLTAELSGVPAGSSVSWAAASAAPTCPRLPLTCARPPYPPLRRLDASPRGAALDAGAAGRDPDGLADGHPLRHLRSDIEELLPRNAPSVVAIQELRSRMAGLQYLGVIVDVGAPDHLPAGERFLRISPPASAAIPKSEVSDVRTGFAAERAFVEKHAGSLMALDDLKTIRERVEARLHWEYAKKTDTLLDADEPAPPLDFTDIEHKYAGQLGGGDLEGNRFSNRQLGLTLMLIEVGGFSTSAAQAGDPHPQGGGRHAGAGRDRRLRPRDEDRVHRRRRHLGRGDGRAGPGPDPLVGAGGGGRPAGHRPLLWMDAQHPGAVPAAGALRGLRLRAGQPAALPDHRAQFEHRVPGVDHHRQRDQLRHHPAGPLPRVAPAGEERRGGAGGGAVGDALGNVVGGAGSGRGLRVAGRHAVPRLPAVRGDRRPGDGVRLGNDRAAHAAALELARSRAIRAAGPPPLGALRRRDRPDGGSASVGLRQRRAGRHAGGGLGGAALRTRPAGVRLLAAATARHLEVGRRPLG